MPGVILDNFTRSCSGMNIIYTITERLKKVGKGVCFQSRFKLCLF